MKNFKKMTYLELLHKFNYKVAYCIKKTHFDDGLLSLSFNIQFLDENGIFDMDLEDFNFIEKNNIFISLNKEQLIINTYLHYKEYVKEFLNKNDTFYSRMKLNKREKEYLTVYKKEILILDKINIETVEGQNEFFKEFVSDKDYFIKFLNDTVYLEESFKINDSIYIFNFNSIDDLKEPIIKGKIVNSFIRQHYIQHLFYLKQFSHKFQEENSIIFTEYELHSSLKSKSNSNIKFKMNMKNEFYIDNNKKYLLFRTKEEALEAKKDFILNLNGKNETFNKDLIIF